MDVLDYYKQKSAIKLKQKASKTKIKAKWMNNVSAICQESENTEKTNNNHKRDMGNFMVDLEIKRLPILVSEQKGNMTTNLIESSYLI